MPDGISTILSWSYVIIPETVYQTRLLLLFSLFSIALFFIIKDITSRKRILIILGVLFLTATTHPLCAAAFISLVILIYLTSHSTIENKLYYFILFLGTLFLSPFLIFNTFNIESIFYSFITYYTLYKLIHYYIEVNKNSTFKRGIEDFLFYILFFPCLCHGPIERINTLTIDSLKKEEVVFGLKKIGWGLIKLQFYFYILKDLQNKELPDLFITYIKTINFYLQLSADWDIVIGVARLMGVRVRENFPHNPFFQPNMTKFWRNCNATIIDWYFSYFYIPLAKNERWVNMKLVTVFMLILGMHAFFNTLKFPSANVILYYVLMGAWFGVTLVISKRVNDYFRSKEVKKVISRCPPFLNHIIYGKSMIRYLTNVIINFNIISFGLWHSPFYKLLTMAWRTS